MSVEDITLKEKLHKALMPFVGEDNTETTRQHVFSVVVNLLGNFDKDQIQLEVGTTPHDATQIDFIPKNIYTALLLDGIIPPPNENLKDTKNYLAPNGWLYCYNENNEICKKFITRISKE